MNYLDLRTIFASSVFSISICTLMIGVLWMRHRHASKAFSFWIAGYVLQCAGVIAIVLRSPASYYVSLSFGVPLFLTGVLLIVTGLEYYVRKTTDLRRWWMNCAWLAIFIVVHVWFFLVRDSLPVRTTNYCLGLIYFFGQAFWFLSRGAPADSRRATRMVTAALCTFVVVSVLRACVEFLSPSGREYFESGPYNSLFVLVYQMLIVWFTFSLFLMVDHYSWEALEQDIAARKQAEEFLRSANAQIASWNRELEQRVKEKTDQLLRSARLASVGQLAAGVAHELNSPLAGLLCILHSYRKNLKGGSPESEEILAMYSAAEYMAKVVGDLGLYVRESGGALAEVSCNEILESISSFCFNQLGKANIHIIKEYDQGLLPVMADRRRLQQVFLNMATNARDAMPQGGTFTLRTGNAPDGKSVFVEFSDTGVGIRDEDLPRLFEPFFTTKEPGRGIGLGLSIVEAIVKEHGGTIRVESAPGKGSTFRITLPAFVK